MLVEPAVPWFPRHPGELDRLAQRTRTAGTELTADHAGFHDPDYRARRAAIAALAERYRWGQPFPYVSYTAAEVQTWGVLYRRLRALHGRYACAEFQQVFAVMAAECGYAPDRIPQGRDVSAFLTRRTGFQLRPVAGLLESRDFLNALAYRVFFCTQYLRHPSTPLYTPEPDVCHELIGHAPMFADPAFADLSQDIGLASLGASDAQIERLARCYWHSVEFGLVWERGAVRAYGAGLLSSFGELEHACTSGHAERRAWDPAAAADQPFPITAYQPVYYVAASLPDASARMRAYCESVRARRSRIGAAGQAMGTTRSVS